MIGQSEDKKNVTVMRLTVAVAQKRIREIAQKTENVILGTHARERMSEREIFDVDVFRVLREGYVDDAPELTERNEWKCKIALKIKGGRTAGIVTIILHNGKLFVKTVEWENL
jgi:Domain of unknown function (DUF4258)